MVNVNAFFDVLYRILKKKKNVTKNRNNLQWNLKHILDHNIKIAFTFCIKPHYWREYMENLSFFKRSFFPKSLSEDNNFIWNKLFWTRNMFTKRRKKICSTVSRSHVCQKSKYTFYTTKSLLTLAYKIFMIV
jgi:hypothetical protein